jgi:hypothetical protein
MPHPDDGAGVAMATAQATICELSWSTSSATYAVSCFARGQQLSRKGPDGGLAFCAGAIETPTAIALQVVNSVEF